ncbi:MAG TPA: hypothetical protein VHQ93_09140 [Chitinophagaceae bacterium]|nr:hypothetical protein [Chitinophagaceae bacterium]
MLPIYSMNGRTFLIYRHFSGAVWKIKASPGPGGYCDKHIRFVTESEVTSQPWTSFSSRTGLYFGSKGFSLWINFYAQNFFTRGFVLQKEKIPLGTHIGVSEKYQCYHYPLTKLANYEKVFIPSFVEASFYFIVTQKQPAILSTALNPSRRVQSPLLFVILNRSIKKLFIPVKFFFNPAVDIVK